MPRQYYDYAYSGYEPSIADLLADPAGQALMRADGVTVGEILSIIARRGAGNFASRPLRRPPSAAASALGHKILPAIALKGAS